MSFLHLSLIAGLATVTVPILLHMFGQRQPTLVDFPALRFVRQTTLEQSSSWQLRHFLLLILRILLLAAMVFALSRPRVHSAVINSMFGITAVCVLAALATLAAAVARVAGRPTSVWLTAAIIALALWSSAGLWGFQTLTSGPVVAASDQSAPVAVAIILDNGPTMSYRSAGRTRLDAAMEMTLWILDELPLDSRVAVLNGAPIGSLSLDPTTAKAQIKIIEPRDSSVDLLGRLRTAIDLVSASELQRKEIYVVTDLCSSAWSAGQADLRSMLDQHSDQILVQIIDVGTQDRSNWKLGNAIADFPSVPVGGNVTFQVEVQKASDSQDDAVTVELLREPVDPRLPIEQDDEVIYPRATVVDRRVVEFSGSQPQIVQLSSSNLQEGSNNFMVRLDKPDPLPLDNQRYLSIPAYSPLPTLVVATAPEMMRLIRALVDPTSSGLADQISYSQLGNVEMEKFACVCLYDPPQITATVANKLMQHVQGGGGLLIILGPQLDAGADPTASEMPWSRLLPGALAKVNTRSVDSNRAFLTDAAWSHPVFGELSQWAEDGLWNRFPIFQSWLIRPLADDAQILMRYSDDATPAVIFQAMGRGRIVTLTTPIPEPETRTRPLWNRLWATEDALPAYGLLLGAIRTLSGADYGSMDFQAGQTISLANDARKWPQRYTCYSPNGRTRRIDADAADGQLLLGQVDLAGLYYLRGQKNKPLVRAVSVNTLAENTDLSRLDRQQLDELLGEGNFKIAQDQSQVESSIGQARFGRELYPLLMALVAGLFLAEQAMSNRFYKIRFRA
ncbi:MAG: BatA domain-containing protein [Planctomycetales bacterium]|nr:BatA domain-containing protein [Planctomycetales bacterium]